jgi:ribonucleoside-diphosphate reductase alpha chain
MLRETARQIWDECLALGREHGYRNSQVTVIAPTGTIAFMMDCDTTGIEPDIALVKYKSLAGGGMLKIVNRTVPMALKTLGYDDPTIRGVLDHIDAKDTIEGAPGLLDEHLPVFDCAFPPPQGGRTIHWRGHVGMMAAAQPFLSGAISKTVNMPREATVQDIENAYLEGWRLGLKALAIYRDGSKESQPVSTKSEDTKEKEKEAAANAQAVSDAADAAALAAETLAALDAVLPDALAAEPVAAATVVHQISTPAPTVKRPLPRRERLPETRRSVTHKFDIQGHEGYLTVGFFDDGRPGELFITMAKEGSTVGGLMDVVGTLVSMGLQYGVPLEVFVNKFAHSRFAPAGVTKNPEIPIAKSITDYIFRWLGIQFVDGYREANTPSREDGTTLAAAPAIEWATAPIDSAVEDAATAAPTIKTNGHRKATAGDVEHAEPEAHSPTLAGFVSVESQQAQFARFQSDAPACDNCGALTVRCGTCYRCFNCGNSMGCS